MFLPVPSGGSGKTFGFGILVGLLHHLGFEVTLVGQNVLLPLRYLLVLADPNLVSNLQKRNLDSVLSFTSFQRHKRRQKNGTHKLSHMLEIL